MDRDRSGRESDMNVNLKGLASVPLVPATRDGGLAAQGRAEQSLAALALPQDVIDRRREGEGTLLQLQAAQRSMVSDRKAAAKQKLDQAKARLQMLRMFAGDPKAMARQAKQIAQEIREAARAYGAAGATEAPAEATSTKTAAGGEAAVSGAARETAGQAGAETPPDAAKEPEIQVGDAGTAAEEGSTGEPRQPTAEEERQKAADAYRAAAQDIASRGAKGQAEREEIEQFKAPPGRRANFWKRRRAGSSRRRPTRPKSRTSRRSAGP